MLRLAHVSDVHLFCPEARWRLGDWFSRRWAGWWNHRFWPRARLFEQAEEVLRALVADVHERRPDLLLFTGDATALGFAEEFAKAANLLRVGDPSAVPGLAVPGNHDYYTHRSTALGHFEKYFQPWLEGERIDGAMYPFARKIGPVYLIAVNSSKPSRWPWDATGRVGERQRDRLRQLLAQPRIAACPRFLVTHYPICLADRRPESRVHGLLDVNETVAVAQAGGVGLWLHGHRHHPYEVASSSLSAIPSICAGSGTQRDVWSYAEYAWDGERLRISRRRYGPQRRQFVSDDERVEWRLPL